MIFSILFSTSKKKIHSFSTFVFFWYAFLSANLSIYVLNIDFAKKLQSLARKGDKELLTVFEASFDGIKFDQESFDIKFFLSNARGLIKDLKDQDGDWYDMILLNSHRKIG